MNIKKVFQNAVFRFLISYLLVLVVPMLIVSMGFQVAFRIVENNLKVTHINMLQRSADVIENELLDMETMAYRLPMPAPFWIWHLRAEGMEIIS